MTEDREDGWRQTTRSLPCPICENTDWCRIGKRVVHCKRIESSKPAKNGGWYHPLSKSAADALPPAPKPKPRKSDQELHAIFRSKIMQWRRPGDPKVAELATALGVSPGILDVLHVVWTGACWAIPERTPAGLIVGVSLRHKDGQKQMMIDSMHGLVYPADILQYRDQTILLVEGMSDTAASLTIGIPAVGRPNNQCGADMLIRLLARWTGRIVVMGENDRREPKPIKDRPHPSNCQGCMRCFPGKAGAEIIAKALREALKPPVSMRMPPDGAKDLRSFLNGIKVDPSNRLATGRIGASILRRLGVY